MAKIKQIDINQHEELKVARKNNKDKNIERRLKALILRAEGKKLEEIKESTGYSTVYISKLVSKYCTNGIGAIIENHQKGNRRNMSFEEESKILEKFEKQAQQGQMIEISEIKAEYEIKLGRKLNSKGHIYNVLKRHGWRKIMPRQKHPNKASDEAIEASKKLTFDWRK